MLSARTRRNLFYPDLSLSSASPAPPPFHCHECCFIHLFPPPPSVTVCGVRDVTFLPAERSSPCWESNWISLIPACPLLMLLAMAPGGVGGGGGCGQHKTSGRILPSASPAVVTFYDLFIWRLAKGTIKLRERERERERTAELYTRGMLRVNERDRGGICLGLGLSVTARAEGKMESEKEGAGAGDAGNKTEMASSIGVWQLLA